MSLPQMMQSTIADIAESLGGNTGAAHVIAANLPVWDALAQLGATNKKRVIEERLVVLRRARAHTQKQRDAMKPVHAALMNIQEWQPRAEYTQVFDGFSASLTGCVEKLTALIESDEAELDDLDQRFPETTPTPKKVGQAEGGRDNASK